MLETFLNRYENTPTWPRVMLTLDRHYRTSDRKYRILKQVYQRMPNTKFGERALLRLGQWRFTSGDLDRAEKYFEKLRKETDRDTMKKTTESYLTSIQQQRNE